MTEKPQAEALVDPIAQAIFGSFEHLSAEFRKRARQAAEDVLRTPEIQALLAANASKSTETTQTAPAIEPVAWYYEYAQSVLHDGRGGNFRPMLSQSRPKLPDNRIRNLAPLYSDAVPAAFAKSAKDPESDMVFVASAARDALVRIIGDGYTERSLLPAVGRVERIVAHLKAENEKLRKTIDGFLTANPVLNHAERRVPVVQTRARCSCEEPLIRYDMHGRRCAVCGGDPAREPKPLSAEGAAP